MYIISSLFSIIRDEQKRGASSIIGYHPKKDWSNYIEEEKFRSFCCNSSSGCQDYFIEARPVDDKMKKYYSPIGGIFSHACMCTCRVAHAFYGLAVA